MVTRLYEWDKNETWWTWIEVTDNKVINLILRSLNNLIKVNDNNEVYVDLQLEDWIENSDTLPIWVNVGRVLAADGRPVTWTLISGQTTSWDRVKVLYGDDWKIRVDNWTNEWKILQYELTAWDWIEILNGYDYSAMQWPAPAWYHVPLNSERQEVVNIWTALGWWASDWANFSIALKLPFTGFRWYSSSDVEHQSLTGYYWASTAYDDDYAHHMTISSAVLYPQIWYYRSCGFAIRCFKNYPVTPTSSWTKLYWTSIAEWGIFWNSSNWLISLSSDWTNWITIADKNLWATQVWNNWDVLSETNCGKYYQWWNNYGFPRTWVVTTSSTQVDASSYWPWNYYDSDTFITRSDSPYIWDTTDNKNLWWGETWIVQVDNVINNTWVLSVDWKTWHVHVEQPNVCEITVQIVDTDYIWTATKIWDLVDGATIIWHSNGLQGLQWLSIAWVSYTILNWIDALDNWTHFYGIYREWYWVIIYSFNNN